MRTFRKKFRHFLADEHGLILAEALVLLPILIWALLAMFMYWDVFKSINVNQKASYSIADLLSRQEDEIETDYLDGLQEIMDFLTPSNGSEAKIRITSFEYHADDDEYCLLFSYSPAGKVTDLYDEDEIQLLKPKIPILSDLESVFVVETNFTYRPRFNIGLLSLFIGVDDMSVGEFIVTRPRHRRLVLKDNLNCI